MEKQEEFALEQVVWVKTGDKHEEPGTIIGCTSGSDNENGKSEILVRLHVSAYKLACDPSQLRSLDEESTSTSQRRISRRLTTSRSLITPSPRVDMLSEDDDDDQKPAAKRKQYDGTIESVSEDNAIFEGDAEASSPYFKRSKISEISSTDTQIYISEAERARKSFPKSNAAAIALQCDTDALSHSASDDDDEEDRPFTIDFAPTSRATCRRCDQSIFKGNLRVSHVPLFRGKPGFRVSRHLECAIFSEDIDKAEDVGGWKKLSTEDYEALVLRVEESKLEIAKENEELEPDELVQVAFQGETRKSPPGLVATLLPFQVEGHAWMYHQEVHVSEIRGGILADEMGMVRPIFRDCLDCTTPRGLIMLSSFLTG